LPNRIGAVASFHGGGLATDAPDSPHLLAPKMKAQFLIAVAENDDQRNPQEKEKLGAALVDRPQTDGTDLGPVASVGLWHAFGDGAVAPVMAGDVTVGAGTLSGVSPGLSAEIGGTWRKGNVGVDVGWSVASRLVTEETPLAEGPGPGPARDTITRASLGTGPAVSVALGEADGTRVRTGVAVHAVPERQGTGFEALWTLGLDHGVR